MSSKPQATRRCLDIDHWVQRVGLVNAEDEWVNFSVRVVVVEDLVNCCSAVVSNVLANRIEWNCVRAEQVVGLLCVREAVRRGQNYIIAIVFNGQHEGVTSCEKSAWG